MHIETIRNEFAKMPQVENISLSYEIPDGNNGGQVGVWNFGEDSTKAVSALVLQTDEKYLPVYQIPLKQGNNFEGNRLDSGKLILNEAAVATLGFKDANDAVGKQVKLFGDPTTFTIKGVTTDFHFGSMQQKVLPIVMLNVDFTANYRYLSFKMKPGNIALSISALQHKWATLLPGAPFEYKFMDETLQNLYKTEIQLKRAANVAAALALIIALLGVVGLVALSIQKRTKEIGIRKILGSSVKGIVLLFIKDFAFAIFIGAFVACPVAYSLMHGWLNGYAYRIAITPVPFLIAIIFLVIITSALIIIQTIKAANSNPAKSLKTE
jgi:ABC-type antimicrobial peptide transport system permease subunit